MKTAIIHRIKICRPIIYLGLYATLLGVLPDPASGQVRFINGRPVGGSEMPGGMPSGMDSPPSSKPDSGGKDAGGPWLPSEVASTSITSTNADRSKTNVVEDIQLSFQGANIDMIVQWLAQQTGKTVVKHPRVQCQLTITSSKKVSPRQAIVLVYRALALEGFTAIESSQSIMIVPEGSEPKMSPELTTASGRDLPEGRQKLVKVFSLKHIQAADLKDRIRIALTGTATLDIDEKANQIIITDYNDNIRVAGELIEALDTDKPDDVAVRMLPLKNVGAVQIAKEIGPLYQKMSGKSLDVAADERANALIILSSDTAFRAIQKLVASLDTEDALEKSSVTFILKNADAQDVAKQLQDLNQSSTVQARYIYNYGGGGDSTQKKVSVVADRRRNAVIVQAPPAQMDGIRKMIEELDAPIADNSLAPRIYPLKYASAVDIEEVLNELFLKKQQQRSYWDYYNDDSSQSTADRDVGRLYGKVRITSEPHSNALIITSNSKENLAVVEDVLNQLDQPSEGGESTLRIGLKFAKANTVANSLNILFAKNGSPGIRPGTQPNQGGGNASQNSQQQQPQSGGTSSAGFNLEQQTKEDGYYPWLGGQPDNDRSGTTRNATRAVSDLVGRVRTVADERGNSVLISANVHYFPQILKLINDLDAASDQVSIEARIVEVSTDYLDKLGVRWSPDGKTFTGDDLDNSLLVHGTANYQKGFGGNTTVNNPQSATAIQQLTSLRSGEAGGSVNMDFLIQFLKKNTDASVIGSPQITINDNETGKLFVGQQVPVPDSTQLSTAGSKDTSIKYKDVGVVLEVTPHINNNGDVQLKIHAESSTVVPGVTILNGAVFDTRNFRTDLTSRNGQTLVLGGIIQRQVSDIQRRTPILGYIPIIEWAFKKQDKSQHQVELMVFLRTKVVRTPDEAKELLHDVDKKAPQLQKWQDDNQLKPKKRW